MQDRRKLMETVALRYWRRKDAELVIGAWRASGESLAGFSRRWSLKPARIARWVTRLDAQPPVVFHPIIVADTTSVPVPSQNAAWVAEITREAWTVRVPLGFDAVETARLLSVVAQVERC